MGTLRQSGIITQSTDYPYTVLRNVNFHTLQNSAGVKLSFGINGGHDPVAPTIYCYADDGGVFTDETADALSAGDNDVALLPVAEAINDAFYFGSTVKFTFVKIKLTTAGVGDTIAWEYYNGSAWTSLSVTDGTSGFTAVAGIYDVTFTPPSAWAQVAVNGTTAWWVRARCTAANFTTQPLAGRIWVGGEDKYEMYFDLMCDTTETVLLIGTYKQPAQGIWDLYINNVLDSSGYDDYAAVGADTTRAITLTQPVRKGWNQIKIKINGKNASATDYSILVYGIAVY